MVDYDRPVANRGLRDMELMGTALHKRALIPDFVLSSGALRAYDTAKGICNYLGYKGKIKTTDALYFEGVSAIERLVQSVSDKHQTLLVFFHNPDINEIAIDLLGLEVENVPTLGCVFTECEERYWKNWSYKNTTVSDFLKPKWLR